MLNTLLHAAMNFESSYMYPEMCIRDSDRSGCFSGSAIEEDGKMQLYYTGVNYLTENPEDINLCVDEHFVSAQLKITSEDGFHFDNIKDKKTVIPVIHDKGIGDARHTRDPVSYTHLLTKSFTLSIVPKKIFTSRIINVTPINNSSQFLYQRNESWMA